MAENEAERARQRVMWVSAIYGALVLATGVGAYCLQSSFVQGLAGRIREIARANGSDSSLQQLQVPDSSGLASAANAAALIAVGLAVPACGFLGARQNSKACIFAFCGCSCLSCCLNLFTLLALALYLSIIGILDSSTVALQRCDPYNLCPKEAGIWQTERVVDCMARSTWPDQYASLYPDFGTQNPPKCYLDVLDCEPDPVAPAPVPAPALAPASRSQEAPRQEQRQAPATLEEPPMDDWLEEPQAKSQTQQHMALDRLRRLLEKAPAVPDAEWSMQIAAATASTAGATRGRRAQALSRMPSDPLTQCRANPTRIEVTHNIIVWLTQTLPQYKLYMQLLVAAAFASTVLSCLSLWWGKQLHEVQAEPAFQPLPEYHHTHVQPNGPWTGH